MHNLIKYSNYLIVNLFILLFANFQRREKFYLDIRLLVNTYSHDYLITN